MTRRTFTLDDVKRTLDDYEERHGCTFDEYVASLTVDGQLIETEEFRRWSMYVAIERRFDA